VLLLGVGVLLAATATTWLLTRPVTLTVVASPADARIELAGGSRSATGSLQATGLAPGTYPVEITRTGFETLTAEVDARRLRGGSVRLTMQPLPQRLSVRVLTSPDASVRVLRGEDELLTGSGAASGTVLAGKVRVLCSAPGRNDYVRELFLDRPTDLTLSLDPEGQVVHIESVVPCSGAPKSVAVTPDGREAWTAILNGPPSIEILDVATGRRAGGVELGTHGAVEVIFDRTGTRAYASQMETARVFEIDTATRKVLRSLPTESSWTKVIALSPDEKTLYAANWSGDDVSEIDLASGKVRRRIRVADTPRGLWPTADGMSLYVAGFGKGELQRIDLASGDVVTLFKSNGAMRHLVADEEAGRLYASDMAKDCIWLCDMKTGAVSKFAKVGHKPNTIDLSPDGRVLFVSNRGENNETSYYLKGPEWGSVLLLDTRNGAPLDGVVGGNQCTALDVSGDGRTLVFSDFLDDTLRVYSVPSFETLAKAGGGRSATLAKDVLK